MTTSSIFHLTIDENRIATVKILTDDQRSNWMPTDFAEQLRQVIGAIIYQQARGVIFISDRKDSFIKGFKPDNLRGKTTEELRAFSQNAQAVMRELNTLKMPVIAAISGCCYGLGVEFILACDYRLAAEEPNTDFALPQVRSGFLPFAGGTQRLPRLIGLRNAAPLLLLGKKINAQTAFRQGLVDRLVPECRLLDTAYQLLLDNQISKTDPSKPTSIWKKARKQLEGNQCYRNRYCDRLEHQTWTENFGNFPAITRLLTLLKERHFKAGLALEQEALAELYLTEVSQVLVNLKRTERAMKRQYGDRANVRDVLRVSILGSGYMGAGIAYLTANNAKVPVRIKDIHPLEIQKALRKCYLLMQQAVYDKELAYGEMVQRMNLITGGERLLAAKSTDFIIEAVYEDLALKQQMLKESEQYYEPHAIFASNTSSFAIRDIASVAQRPENVIGFHYFSPVTKRRLVEIVPHAGTSEQTIATAIHFAIQQNKIPLLVADKPGFFVNRILTPYLLEAIQCVIDGEAIDFIDRSLQEFGFETGPLALLDEIGLDVLVKTNPTLVEELGERFALPEQIELLLQNDRKGSKNRRGFYLYDSKGNPTQEDKSIYHVMETITRNDLEAEQIARRCILRMINEACWCLQDGVISSTDEGNVASVLGFDFPKFRGGIYAYIDRIGAKEIVRQLQRHQEQYGNRFTPCEWLIQRAKG